MAVATLYKVDSLITIVERALSGSVPFDNRDDGVNASENEHIVCKPFGRTCDGQLVDIYILRNSSGMEVEILNYGGHIRAVRVPSSAKHDNSAVDVTIGLDNMFDYQHKNRFFGPIVGLFSLSHSLHSDHINQCQLPLKTYEGCHGRDVRQTTSSPLVGLGGKTNILSHVDHASHSKISGVADIRSHPLIQ